MRCFTTASSLALFKSRRSSVDFGVASIITLRHFSFAPLHLEHAIFAVAVKVHRL